MQFVEWEPVYERILADFGYDRDADRAARDLLGSLTDQFDLGRLDFAGERVAVAGAGPSLVEDLDTVRAADRVVAASSAGRTLRDAGLEVDLLVTDLDGHPPTVRALAAEGTPVAIHAHGDNTAALRRHVPRLDRRQVLPTTQAEPSPPVQNFGGFTDGDRAAFLTDHVGAAALAFPGWDLEDPTVGPDKRRKLRWAARLLAWLERRRDERFDVLDGLRDGLDPV
jgi:hypothetical protein